MFRSAGLNLSSDPTEVQRVSDPSSRSTPDDLRLRQTENVSKFVHYCSQDRRSDLSSSGIKTTNFLDTMLNGQLKETGLSVTTATLANRSSARGAVDRRETDTTPPLD